MKNYEVLQQNIADALSYIQTQQQILQPLITYLSKYLVDNMENSGLSYKECLEIYSKLMEQETNSILVISKMQEILTYVKDPKK